LYGKVLTISNDGKFVVVADTVSTPSQVYIYDASSNTSVDLIIPGETATAAAFSPDQLKLFILTSTGKMYVYSTVDALTSVPIATTATDVKFSADGSFAYVAGALVPGTSISGIATCNAQPTHAAAPTPPNFDFVTTPGIPLQIFASPDAQHVLALDPPNGGIDIFTASASTDGSQVYVAACDQYAANGVTCAAGSVHIVCTTSCTTGQGDFQQVPYVNINDNNNPNMCNGQGTNAPLCLPNVIAIKPQ